MSEWKEYIFKDLFEIPLKNGLNKPSKVRGDGFRMINMKEIFGYNFIGDDTPMELVPLEEREKLFLQFGDLLFARQSLVASGAGKVSYFRGFLPTVFESHLIRCRINPYLSNSLFLYYLIKSPYGRGKIETIVEQTAAAGIRGSDLKELKFKIPPLHTQTAIAEILSSLDDKIELNNKINQELENLAQTLFRQWFIDFEFPNENGEPYKSSGGEMVESELGEIPKGWEVKRLKQLLTIKRGGSPRPIHDFMADSGLPWVKISDATALNSPFLFSTKEFIKVEGLRKTVLLRKGSLILSNSATPGLPKFLELDACIHDGWLHFDDIEQLTFNYLYLLFISIRVDLVGQGNGSIFINLKTDILKEYAITVPTSDVINEFSNLIDPIFNKIKNVSSEIIQLTNLRDTLLPELISGELEVSQTQTTT